MKKSLLVWLIQLLTMPVLGQEPEFRKNVISYEVGLWSRGICGISYTRNFCKKDLFYWSADISAGVGVSLGGFHNYFVGSTYLNAGEKGIFLIAGAEVKYYDIVLESNLFKEGNHYSGFTASPVLGICAQTPGGFTFRMRGSALPVIIDSDLQAIRPSIGASFGYSF